MAEPGRGSPPGKRVALALFKSSENDTAETNLCRRFAASHLEKIGYRVEYRDIEAGLPSEAQMAPYTAVITWFRGPQMKEALAYPHWLAEQIRAGRKVVILGNFGAFTPDRKYFTPNNFLNEFFVPFGLNYKGQWTNKAPLLRVVSKEPSVVESPAPLDLAAIAHYVEFTSLQAENKSWLVVERTDVKDSKSSIVVRTPSGGMALEGYLYTGAPESPGSWHLNLATFLADSLGYQAAQTGLPKKRVLGLYKGSEFKNPGEDAERANEIRMYAWEPLYRLGYDVDLRDVDKGWPSLAEMGPYDAIITWFRGPTMPRAAEYAEWLADNMEQGRRVIVLGNYGAFQERIDGPKESYFRFIGIEEYNNFFSPFGLEFLGQWTNDPKLLKVAFKDSKMVECEVPLNAEDVKHYYKFAQSSSQNEPYLVLDRTDLSNGQSPVIARTAGGGFALESYILVSKPPDWVLRWRLNLPEFLKRSLTFTPSEKPHVVFQKAPDEELLQIPSGTTPITFPRYAGSALPADGTEFKRSVLALYKGSEKQTSEANRIHTIAEIVLNHLGIRVDYRRLEDGLPSDEQMAGYLGVVTWFGGSVMDDPEGYAAWVRHQIEQGRRVVVLGDPGLHYKKSGMVNTPGEKAFYAALGMDYAEPGASTEMVLADENTPRGNGTRRLGSRGSTILHADRAMMGFEAPVGLDATTDVSGARSTDSRNKVYLSIRAPGVGRIDPVVTGPFGGLADRDFAFQEAPAPTNLHQLLVEKRSGKWRIDPFRFFTEALGLQETPRLDVTTLNGSRVFYSHIDGDGLPAISLIDRSSLASEFIYREILKAYPLPVTASVITKDIDRKNRKYYNREYAMARAILALDNVEPATHTYSHPFNWRQGDLRPVALEPQIKLEQQPTDLPRQITYSINTINRYLVPPGKRVEIVLWSGNTDPSEQALELVDANGCRNMNGGDPLYDKQHPSYSTLCALTEQVGNRRKYHTSGQNEFLYTDGWTKNFDGMKRVVDHFTHTESPRRVMAINIYYHYYLGDRQLGLEGLKAPYDYAMRNHVAPLFASQYVDSVSDWMTARLFRKGDGWVVVNSGMCRTVRFDLKDRYVDMQRSKGVLGYNHANDSLYVHLDESDTHEVYLTKEPARGLHLVQGSHYISQWAPQGGGVTFNLRGLGPAYLVLGGFKPGQAVPVEVRRADEPEAGAVILQKSIPVDAQGRLVFDTVLKGYNRVYTVRVGSAGAALPVNPVGVRR